MWIPQRLSLGTLLVAGCLTHSLILFSALAAGGVPKYSTNIDDKLACERQLNIIYGALTEYQKDHNGHYPETLQELTPTYLHDGKLLFCPHAQKRGGLKDWKKNAKELSPDYHTSYGFEFGIRILEESLWRGVPRKTWRDYKLESVQKIGSIVPVVRCLDHRPYLNLAVDGWIYECPGLYWEEKFSLEERFQVVQQIFALPAPPPLSMNQFSPRDSRLKASALDLTPYYNGLLTNSWQGFPGNDLASLPAGFHEFDGTQFDIRGVIQLQGLEIPVQFPARLEGIKVGRKCARLHFVHAISTFSWRGFTNGFYVLHYSDGQKREIPLIYGQDIADWWPDARENVTPTTATVAWSGQNIATRTYEKSIRLYHSTFVNTLPDVDISTITFDSKGKTYPAGPFVVAITLDPK